MKSRIIICGKSASGKDYLRKSLEKRGFIYAVPYTSRPQRKEEIDGKDYNFISETAFKNLSGSGFFFQQSVFNNWHYGVSKGQWFDGDDIFIMTPKDIKALNKESRESSFIIYLDIPLDERKSRLIKRIDNNDSIERRILADENDFEDFTDYDIRITNNNF
jgi:guanylate kinase